MKRTTTHKKKRRSTSWTGPEISEDLLAPYVESVLRPRNSVLPWELDGEFEKLRVRLLNELKPEGKLELLEVEKIVTAAWKLQRINRTETGMVAGQNLALALFRANDKKARLLVPYDLRGIATPESNTAPCSPGEPNSNARTNMPTGQIGLQADHVYHPTMVDEGLAFTINGDGDPLTRLHLCQKSVEQSLQRAKRELERLQGRRRARSALSRFAMDLRFADVDAEIARRRVSARNRTTRLKKPKVMATPQGNSHE